jgi:hypothetical protein
LYRYDSVSSLEEINLLIEARRGLEELFLLVIVGEFNAGKSKHGSVDDSQYSPCNQSDTRE